MTPVDYQQVKEIFARAVQAPSDQRESLVRQQCGDDQQVLQEVLSLLRHHLADTILEPPLDATSADASTSELATLAAGNIGHN